METICCNTCSIIFYYNKVRGRVRVRVRVRKRVRERVIFEKIGTGTEWVRVNFEKQRKGTERFQ